MGIQRQPQGRADLFMETGGSLRGGAKGTHAACSKEQSRARLPCVPKLYPTRATGAVLAIPAARKISNLRGVGGDREFESHPRLQLSGFKSMDYNFLLFPALPSLGTFGNNWKKSRFQSLNCTPVRVRNRMRIDVQRGLDTSVP